MRDFSSVYTRDRATGLLTDSGLSLVCGLVLTILGPFGSAAAPVSVRLIYWVGLSLAWMPVGVLSGFLLAKLPRFRKLPRGRRVIALLLIRTVPMTALVLVVTQLTKSLHFTSIEIVLLYAKVGLLTAGLDYVAGQIDSHGVTRAVQVHSSAEIAAPTSASTQDVEARPAATSDGNRLSERLLPEHRGRIRYLSVEDHYVRVHTDRGAPLLLMRFGTALEELDGLPGERVHRSWWVASTEPCTFRRDGRRAWLELDGDLTIPVSTPYLVAAGALSITHRHAAKVD